MKKKHLISVVIPLKNTKENHRGTKRLQDCLNSLKNQTVPCEQIDIIVTDIDSDPYYKGKHKEICKKYKIKYIFTKTDGVWNISRARNIGIRNAQAEFIMTTDVDCVFAPDFIETVLQHTTEDKIIHCRISDLPKDYEGKLDDFLWMNKTSTLRPPYGYGGCQVFSRKWAFKVHGFDEAYSVWGADDTDFYLRATQDGLKSIWIEREASFFHQHHETENNDKNRAYVSENRLRLKLVEMGKMPIIRNETGWGGKGSIAVHSKTTKGILNNVAILITTFMRDAALFNCVESIRKYYPDITIFVGDNGEANRKKTEFLNKYKCAYVKAPFDCGVGETRNKVFKKIPKRYKHIMICEDDIIFTASTMLGNWVSILEGKDEIGIVGGKLNKHHANLLIDMNYEAWLYADKAALYIERIKEFKWELDVGARYVYCDIVLNVFMMRREVWDSQGWDPKIKTWPEHEDFFFSVKKNTDWKVAYTDTVSMTHEAVTYDRKYAKYRMRTDGLKVFSEKWGIEYIWNSWHKSWGKPNPLRIGFLVPAGKKPKLRLLEDKSEIAVGIKTFLREATLFKALDAIEKYLQLPHRLYIADDGEASVKKEYRYQQLENKGHEIIKLPFNSGISVGRNEVIKKAIEDYILIMDDDIALQDSTSIIKMKNILDANDDIGICSGMLFSENGDYMASEKYQKGLRFEIDRGMLLRHPSINKIHKVGDAFYVYADQVVNFFLAKRAVFDDITWDNRIKVEWEHLDFFLRLKETKWKVASCINSKATHLNSLHDPNYNYYRRSSSSNYFNNKHGIHRVINRF